MNSESVGQRHFAITNGLWALVTLCLESNKDFIGVEKRIDKQIDEQTDWQMDRQTDRVKHMYHYLLHFTIYNQKELFNDLAVFRHFHKLSSVSQIADS